MKFAVNKKIFQEVLSKIQGLTGRKSSLAITSNVLIRAGGSDIHLSATDLETGFEGTYPAMVEMEGEAAVNARKLYEIIREFPFDEIVVQVLDNQWIEISGQNIEYRIVGMNPGDFPATPRMEQVDLYEIDSAALRRMIERTVMIGSSPDDKRAHIAGVYFEKVPGNVFRMVATDGSRLSKVDYTSDKDTGPETETGVLIPKKGLSELGKFLESEGSVRVGIQDNHFVVRRDLETLVIRLLEGGFPDYREIVKKEPAHVLRLDRQAFLMMMKRMSILSSDDYKGVVFHFSDNRFVVSTTNPDLGESREETATDFQGKSMEIAFNPRYFIDTLNAMETDSVMLQLIDEEKPCMIEGENDNSFVSVIMPMKI